MGVGEEDHRDLKKFLRNPFQILVKKEELTSEKVVTERKRHYQEGIQIRIGSGSQFGRKAVALNIEEKKILCDTEPFYHTTLEEMPMNVDDLI
ncbi:eukaryotic initiation factor 4A-like [Monodon monoceros]|uniref:eukaryotic initiation factor 4A-like n=1 Tax=Monodon monoceros TaxID=40151 RepID=UPI0010FA592E|nr:eukaryotic initiation factor 4A-like [Monodon monoceros]